ncbi:MAG: 2-dehydropantoate 2-reductase [Candidatus Brocadiia bacterium]
MRIAIAGPGAVGQFIAFNLAPNNEVVAIHKDRLSAEQARREGFRFDDGTGAIAFRLPVLIRVPADTEILFVCMKTWALDSFLSSPELRAFEGCAITLQNGLGNCEKMVTAMPAADIWAGALTYGVMREANGVVRLKGMGSLVTGRFRCGSLPVEDSLLKSILVAGGLNTSISREVPRMLWLKAGVSTLINPLAALREVHNGELLQMRDMPQIWREMAREVSKAASTAGVTVTPEELIEAARKVASDTALNICSMLQDLRAGRQTEISSTCGEIACRLEKIGIFNSHCRELHTKVTKRENTGSKV